MSENNIYDIVPELTEKDPEQPPKKKLSKKSKKAFFWSAVALVSALVLAAGIIFGIPYYEKISRPIYSTENMPLIYTTETPELFVYDKISGSSDVLSSLLLDKNSSSPYVISDITVDGKSFFFIDSMGDLYRSNIDISKENVFISESVTGFMLDYKGNTVYLLDDGSLIYCKFNKDRTTFKTSLIDSGVDSFKLSDDGKKVVYIKALEKGSNLFYAKLGNKIKTSFLYEDCGEFTEGGSPDLSTVFTMKISENGKKTIIKTTSLRNSEIVVRDADIIYSIGEDGSVIYGMNTGNGVDFSSYFTDNSKDADLEIEEPNFSDYLYGNISFDTFSAAEAKWNAKLGRDEIRKMLSEMTGVNSNYDLYKHESRGAVLIDKNVSSVLGQNKTNSSVIYTVSDIELPEAETICDISDFETVEDAFLKVTEILSNGEYSHKLYMDDIDVARLLYSYKIGSTDKFVVNPEFTGLYIYSDIEESELHKISYIDFALGNVSAPVTITEAATEPPIISAGNVVICEETINGEIKETNVFFANGGKRTDIGKNILPYSVEKTESGILLYITTDNRFVIKAEEEKVIAEEVLVYFYRSDGSIYYLCKGSTEGHTLHHYNGETSKGIAKKVLDVIPF
jgi:hypothetical protein